MTKLKEWQYHVRRTDESNIQKTAVSWCGATIAPFDFYFVDSEHAALTLAQHQRLQPCPDCARVLFNLFDPADLA